MMWKSIEPDYVRGGFSVFFHDNYERTSVLAGYPRRTFKKHFQAVDDAKVAYPDAVVMDGTTKNDYAGISLPVSPPSWFDESAAGERWEEDY